MFLPWAKLCLEKGWRDGVLSSGQGAKHGEGRSLLALAIATGAAAATATATAVGQGVYTRLLLEQQWHGVAAVAMAHTHWETTIRCPHPSK